MNNNGVLSFGAAWTVSMSTAFPIANYSLVAPYQANVDTRGTGSVWYRSTQDPILLAKAVNDIQALSGTFSPQWLFIGTWDHFGYFPNGTDKVGNDYYCSVAIIEPAQMPLYCTNITYTMIRCTPYKTLYKNSGNERYWCFKYQVGQSFDLKTKMK